MRKPIIDAIRDELRKQAKADPEQLTVAALISDKPDTIHIIGVIDLWELVKAIEQR